MIPSTANDRVLAAHILDRIGRVWEYTEEGKSAFFSSTMIQDSVIRNLQTIAESTQRLSPEVKAEYSAVPWKKIAGFRNVLVHDYLGLDIDSVWLVVERDLNQLEEAVEQMLNTLGGVGLPRPKASDTTDGG